jgi:TolA-binding protein
MIRCLRFSLVFIALTIVFPLSVRSSEIILESNKQFQFARDYMDKGDYRQAVAEFERFIYFFPTDEKIPLARHLIAVCHLANRELESARKVLAEIREKHPATASAREALFLMGESYYRQGLWEEATRWFNKVIEEYPQTELKNAALYRLGWIRMQTNRWQEASDIFRTVEEKSPLRENSIDLSLKSLAGQQLPYKDPTLAGVMAGILPGLGHVYCDRPKDGVVALLLNGLFIWAAVESFHQDREVLGGILAFLELGWYSGNIYSAVNTAHKVNKKVQNDFRRGLPDGINLELFSSKEAPLGLAFRITF